MRPVASAKPLQHRRHADERRQRAGNRGLGPHGRRAFLESCHGAGSAISAPRRQTGRSPISHEDMPAATPVHCRADHSPDRGPTMHGHAPIEGFHPEGDAALGVRSTYSDAHGGARIHTGRRVHRRRPTAATPSRSCSTAGPEHRRDAALRPLDEPVRDDLRAAADAPEADYRVRIFTPVAELPFAGHPTLGTCHAWLTRGGGPPSSSETIVQECAAGLVAVRRRDRTAWRSPPRRCCGPGRSRRRCSSTWLRGVRHRRERRSSTPRGPTTAALDRAPARRLRCRAGSPAGFVDLDIGVAGPHPPGSPEAFEVRAFFPKDGVLSRIRLRGASTPRSPSGSCAAAAPRRPTWRDRARSGSSGPSAHHDGRHGFGLGGRRHHRRRHRHRRALTEPRPPRARSDSGAS